MVLARVMFILMLWLLWGVSEESWAICVTQTSPFSIAAGTTLPDPPCDLYGNQYSTQGTYQSGEDPTATGGGSTNGVMVIEERYLLSATVTSDTQIKGSAGYVKDLNCVGNDAAATAGTIKVEDALTATTPVIFTYTVPAVALTSPVLTFPLGVVMATGIFIDFTTTADVACYVRYR